MSEIISDRDFREAVALGLTAPEIARRYGITPQAVRARARRAKLEFRQTPEVAISGLADVEDIGAAMRRINACTLDLLEQLSGVARGDTPPEAIEHLLGPSGNVVNAMSKVLDAYRKQIGLTWNILQEIASIRQAKQILELVFDRLKQQHPEILRGLIEELQGSGLMPSNRL
jgi:hypothetical protein